MINFNDEILNNYIELLKKYDTYLVGGYLRNYFYNGNISNDRDIVTVKDAKKLALELSEISKGTFIELDRENEIYRVVLKDKINYFDISKALFNDIEKDAKRRDYTINAVFYDIKNEKIYDPFFGIDDIKNKTIKAIDFNNFKDDPLRILRLYRFIAQLDFEVDYSLLEFSKNNFNLIFNCAIERINQEIIKMFEGDYVSDALLKMYDNDVLEKLFPFIKDIKKIPSNSHHHLDLVHHSIETVKNVRTNNPLLKIAAFYHDIGKPSTWTIEIEGRHRFIGHDIKGESLVKNELKKLNFSNKQIQYISKMVRYHIYPAAIMNTDTTNKAFARFVRKLKEDTPDVIELSRADRLSALGEAVSKEMVDKTLNHLEKLLGYYNEVNSIIKAPKSLLDGKEIMELINIKPSKQVGILLSMLLEAQLEGIVKTKEEAVVYIKNKALKRL